MYQRYMKRPSPLDDVDPDAIRAAFHTYTEGEPKFTRRVAIHIADQFGVKPMHMIWRLEKMKLVKSGYWRWFDRNGGITQEQVKIVRADAMADQMAGQKAEG